MNWSTLLENLSESCADAFAEPALHLESKAQLRMVIDRTLGAASFAETSSIYAEMLTDEIPDSMRRGDHIVVGSGTAIEIYEVGDRRSEGNGMSRIPLEPVDYGTETISVVLDESDEINLSEREIRNIMGISS